MIPARGGSKRLPRKNVLPVAGRPLIGWAIGAALGSRHLGPGAVYVSTEDAEIAAAAREAGAGVVERPASLAGDDVWTEPVIRHAVEAIEAERGGVDVVAWMNACVPELTTADIDRACARLIEDDLREVISVDREGRSNSAVRVLRREALFQDRLSVVFAVLRLDYVDIHTEDDLGLAEERLRRRSGG